MLSSPSCFALPFINIATVLYNPGPWENLLLQFSLCSENCDLFEVISIVVRAPTR